MIISLKVNNIIIVNWIYYKNKLIIKIYSLLKNITPNKKDNLIYIYFNDKDSPS